MNKLFKSGRPDFIPRELFRAYLRPRALNGLALIDGIQPMSYVNRERQQGRPFKNRHNDGERCHGIAYRMIDIVARARAHGHVVSRPSEANGILFDIEHLKKARADLIEEVSGVEGHKLKIRLASKLLTGGALLSEDEIVSCMFRDDEFQPSGIYFLISRKKVVYVGQSINVFTRISEHKKYKTFDSFSFLPCDPEQLDVYESLYIHTLRPVLNGDATAEGVKRAPLSLDRILASGRKAA